MADDRGTDSVPGQPRRHPLPGPALADGPAPDAARPGFYPYMPVQCGISVPAGGPPPAPDDAGDAARFRTYFDNSTDCLFHVRATPEGDFTYEAINPVGLAHAGITLDLIRGRTPVQVLGAEIGGLITDGLCRVRDTGRPYAFEPTLRYGTEMVIYDALYMPLFDPGGIVVGVLGRATDITQRRRLEHSLRQAQKMEALGQLAGGIAHDFNNILAAMSSCLALLGRRTVAEEDRILLTEARRSIERGTSLTSRLLDFSRQQPMAREPVDFNRTLAEMTLLLGRTLGRDVRIATERAAGLWPALADRNQVELAIMNLAINARDAMPTGGVLTLTTRNAILSEVQDGGMEAGHYVAIGIQDTGAGMAPDILARARDPFFTTKPPGQGTGLGLSMVQGMMRQLGGGLEIASRPGEGTRVTLYLPRAPEAGAD